MNSNTEVSNFYESDNNLTETDNSIVNDSNSNVSHSNETRKRNFNNTDFSRFEIQDSNRLSKDSLPDKIAVQDGFKVVGNKTGTADVYNKYDLIDGHIYYLSADISENGFNKSAEQFSKQFGKSEFVEMTNLTSQKDNSYESSSKLFKYSENEELGIDNILFSSIESDSFTIKNAVLIDLTAAFGEGYEPDMDWCHANIPSFTGTQSLSVSPASSPGSPNNLPSSKYTFTGKEFDSDIGIYYFGARYYNPSMFVFTQADSLIPDVYNPQALNRYSYCLNNPVTYTDPDGHEAVTIGAVLAFAGKLAMAMAKGFVIGYFVGYSIAVLKQGFFNEEFDHEVAHNEGLIGGYVGAVTGGVGYAGKSLLKYAANKTPIGKWGERAWGYVSNSTGYAASIPGQVYLANKFGVHKDKAEYAIGTFTAGLPIGNMLFKSGKWARDVVDGFIKELANVGIFEIFFNSSNNNSTSGTGNQYYNGSSHGAC